MKVSRVVQVVQLLGELLELLTDEEIRGKVERLLEALRGDEEERRRRQAERARRSRERRRAREERREDRA